jgi:hypothetical protein
MKNNSLTNWRIVALLGVVLSLLGLYMMPLFPISGHVDLSGYGGPVFAFEVARNLTDLINVFGPLGDADRATRIAQMDLGNYWDFLFMIIYSLFMAVFLFAATSAPRSTLWKSLIVIALLSGLADAIENTILLGLTADLEAQTHLSFLVFPVYTKFIAIMIATAAAGILVMRHASLVWKILGALIVAGALTIAPALMDPQNYGWMIGSGITVSWTLMLFFGIANSVKRDDKVS